MTMWPSGLRRTFQVRVLIGEGSNPFIVISFATIRDNLFVVGKSTH